MTSSVSTLPVPSSQSPAAAIRADRLDVLAEERPALEHHLEAVVVGGIVAAGDLDAAVHLLGRGLGVVEHRRRPHADPAHVAAARGEPFDQRVLEHRRADPAVVADRHQLAAGAPQQGAEAAPDRARVVGAERFADDPADVVFAQDGGMELVGHQGSRMVRAVRRAAGRAPRSLRATWRIAAAAVGMDHRDQPLVRGEDVLARGGRGHAQQLARAEHRLSARGRASVPTASGR